METCQKIMEVVRDIAEKYPNQPDAEMWAIVSDHLRQCGGCMYKARQAFYDRGYKITDPEVPKISVTAADLGTSIVFSGEEDI